MLMRLTLRQLRTLLAEAIRNPKLNQIDLDDMSPDEREDLLKLMVDPDDDPTDPIPGGPGSPGVSDFTDDSETTNVELTSIKYDPESYKKQNYNRKQMDAIDSRMRPRQMTQPVDDSEEFTEPLPGHRSTGSRRDPKRSTTLIKRGPY